MDKTVIVLANEPRSYREVIAAAIQSLRPHLEVLVVEPESLDSVVTSLSPDLLICSTLTETLRREARAWVELYPGGEQLATVSLGGTIYTSEGLELEQLLSVVDAASYKHQRI